MRIPILAFAAALFTWTSYALAAEDAASFPSRPIRLIVPTGAGGSMDAMARAAAEEAGRALGQPIIVENRPGAGNTMAAVSMVSAPADGYTLGIISCATLKLPHVQKTQYDPMKDLTYISRLSEFTLVATVRADSPAQSVADLVRQSKSKPVFYGTAGTYNSPHLATIRLAETAGANWTNVPFKGDSEAITALLAGEIAFVATSNSVLPFIQSGKLRAVGVFADKRAGGGFDKVPTMTEQGFPVVETCPFGVMGPKGMDRALVTKIDDAFRKAVASATLRSTAGRFGFEPLYSDHQAFDQWARKSFEQDRAVFTKLGKKPE